jgi:hypothetical protein
LPKWVKLFGFSPRKMLEVRINQAHLVSLPIAVPASFKAWEFVRELFTIYRFAALAEERDLRPVRSIGVK